MHDVLASALGSPKEERNLATSTSTSGHQVTAMSKNELQTMEEVYHRNILLSRLLYGFVCFCWEDGGEFQVKNGNSVTKIQEKRFKGVVLMYAVFEMWYRP